MLATSTHLHIAQVFTLTGALRYAVKLHSFRKNTEQIEFLIQRVLDSMY